MTSGEPLHQTQLASLINDIPGILFFCTSELNQSNHELRRSMRYLSEGCFSLTGYTSSQLLEQDNLSYQTLIHIEDAPAILETIHRAVSNHTTYGVEYRIRTKTGQEKWLWEKGNGVFDAEGKIIGLEGLITDITDIKQTQAHLHKSAFYDQLTNLPNRSLLMDRLDRMMKRKQRHPGYAFEVLFLDLDGFKGVNDNLGHPVGDQLLVAVARRLQTIIRPDDTVARLGGDEFTILLDDVKSMDDVLQVCDRILREVRSPLLLDNQDVLVSTSIGIVLSSEAYHQPGELLRDADVALYQAKAAGKARYTVFNSGMRMQPRVDLELESELRQALPARELKLYYQPIVSLDTGQVVGVEAVLYWQHPRRGVLPPSDFLAVAEAAGMLVSLGQWGLRAACGQLCTWQTQFPADPPLFINVNLSSVEICDQGLIPYLRQTLKETQLNACQLQLELKERTLLTQKQAIAGQLAQLKALGVQLCIDDINVGYQSLELLRQFPIDALKLNRTCVNQIEHKATRNQIRNCLAWADDAGIQVVVKGIETIAQLAQLRALKCQLGQGFFWGRPAEAKWIETRLQQDTLGRKQQSVTTAALPHLVIHTKSGQYHMLLTGRTSWTIGRSPNSNIVLLDRMVSRDHAVLLQVLETGDYYFVDTGSRNGSLLNQKRVQDPVLLKQGDQLLLGKTVFEFWSTLPQGTTASASSRTKTVLMSQASNLQSEIWQDLLSTQEISIIRLNADIDIARTLDQMQICDKALPDLLLLDVATLKPNPQAFLQYCRQTYGVLKVMLTCSSMTKIAAPEYQEMIHQGALDVLLGLPEQNLLAHSKDIQTQLNQVLRALNCDVMPQQILITRLQALQSLMQNQTFY